MTAFYDYLIEVDCYLVVQNSSAKTLRSERPIVPKSLTTDSRNDDIGGISVAGPRELAGKLAAFLRLAD